MTKIKPEEWYSAIRAYKLLGLKNRYGVVKHITSGALRAIIVGGEGAGKRYAIKGEWLQDFKDRSESGVLNRRKYYIPELKLLMKDLMEYCREKNITTLEGLITSINKLK